MGQFGRSATHGDSLGVAAHVGLMEVVAHQTVVTGIVERNKRLDAGVAQILKLLVIGAVSVGLDGTETGCAPTNLHHLPELGIVGIERSSLQEGEAYEGAADVVEHKCLVARLDVEIDIAEGTPVERSELLAVGTA